MKRWIVVEQTWVGDEVHVFKTEADADAFALEWCKDHIEDHPSNDWREIYDTMMDNSHDDSIMVAEIEV